MILEQKETKQYIIIGGIGLLVSLLFLIPFSLFLAFKNPNEVKESTLNILSSSLYCWFCLIIMYVYSIKIEKQKFLIWKEKQYPLAFYFKFFVLAPVISLVVLTIVALILKASHINISPNSQSDAMAQIFRNHKLLMLFAAATAGITEELLFRGYIMSRLELLFKNKEMPILLSSVFFALAHFGYDSMLKLVLAFLMGLALAFLYDKYRNIKILIILHFLWDITVLSIHALKMIHFS